MRPLLSITFPPGFGISKNIGHPTSGSRGKNTDTQTHRQTKIWTNQLIESIGPEGNSVYTGSLKFKTTKLNKL